MWHVTVTSHGQGIVWWLHLGGKKAGNVVLFRQPVSGHLLGHTFLLAVCLSLTQLSYRRCYTYICGINGWGWHVFGLPSGKENCEQGEGSSVGMMTQLALRKRERSFRRLLYSVALKFRVFSKFKYVIKELNWHWCRMPIPAVWKSKPLENNFLIIHNVRVYHLESRKRYHYQWHVYNVNAVRNLKTGIP